MPGRTVARLQLDAPAQRDFVLRGAFPVPRGTYPRPDRFSPFVVRDRGGALKPAQTEIVSRWPDEASGADVVEVLARVHQEVLPPPGATLTYDVVFAPHPDPTLDLHPVVSDLLRTSGRVYLVARDVFGHRYIADIQEGEAPVRELRDGTACREWRTSSCFRPLLPTAGPQGTLPHLMSVQAWFRAWKGDPVLSLDLLIHNGPSGHDATDPLDDPMGTLYFDRIDLWLPAGWGAWQADPDVLAGTPEPVGGQVRVPIVSPLSDDSLHVMPIQAQTVRRLALARSADEVRAVEIARDAGLGFARRGTNAQGEDLLSWWNPQTPGYFPQKQVLPRLDFVNAVALRAELEQRYAWVAGALRNGTAPGYPIVAPALGWAHPWGIDQGGMAGGDEINLYDGLRVLEVASNKGWRLLQMRQRMLTDRQPVALFDADGAPTDYTRWVEHGASGPWLPIWCFLTPLLWAADPFGFTTAPTFQVDAVVAQGRVPPYQAELMAFQPIDLEHLTRYTAPAKALAWIGNDSLAKSALELHAALFRLSYNELPNSDYGHWISSGMGADRNYVDAHPGIGFTYGRMEGWGLDSATAWYALAPPEWRARTRGWFVRVGNLVADGQSQCSGIIEAMVYTQLFGGQYRARQSIESAITEHALVGLQKSVLAGVGGAVEGRVRSALIRSLSAMVVAPSWSSVHHAPWNKLAVGDNDFTHLPFCGPPPADGYADGGDGWQCWSSLAYGYERTGYPIFLQRAVEMVGTSSSLLAGLQQQGLWNLENRAALLALAQQAP